MKKEQSSNSTPKVKYALAEKYKEESKKKRQEEVDGYERLKTKEASKLPAPTGWRMLILPFAGMGVSKGGIQLLQNTIDRETLATVCAYVAKMGPSCYKDAKFEGESWCKEKQWVLIGRYAGAKFKLGDDAECRIINDDEVIATIHDPTDIVAI